MRTDGYLRSFYRRQVRKFGGFGSPLAKKKAIIAVAHKLITIVWHVLTTGRLTRIAVRTTSPAASTPRSRPVASSPNYKPRDTPSPSNPPPDHLNTRRHKITRLRRVASPAVVTSIHVPAPKRGRFRFPQSRTPVRVASCPTIVAPATKEVPEGRTEMADRLATWNDITGSSEAA